MSALLPDESYCKCELGMMLYRDGRIYGFHAEIAGTKEPASLLFGHVDYEIVFTATPHQSLNYEPRRFSLTSRFKELNRLYGQLSTIHKQLYLKGTFPNFVDARLFGTTAPETIAERRRAIESFLNFVLDSDVLRKARVFQAFIEATKEEQQSNSNEAPSGQQQQPASAVIVTEEAPSSVNGGDVVAAEFSTPSITNNKGGAPVGAGVAPNAKERQSSTTTTSAVATSRVSATETKKA